MSFKLCLDAYGVDKLFGRWHVLLAVDNNDMLVDPTK